MLINKIMQTQNNMTAFQANVNLKNMANLNLNPKQLQAIQNAGKDVRKFDKIDISLQDETFNLVTNEPLPYNKIIGKIEYLLTGKNDQYKFTSEYTRIEPSMEEKPEVITERILKFLSDFKN